MKYYFLSFLFFFYYFSNAQGQFQNGYEEGYKEGYCWQYKQNGNIDCITPIVPIAPLADISKGENTNSYSDGWKKGFEDGKIRCTTTKEANPYPLREYGEYIEPYDFDFMLKVLELKLKYKQQTQRINQQRDGIAINTYKEKQKRYEELLKYYNKNDEFTVLNLKDVEFKIDVATDMYIRESWQIDNSTPFLLSKDKCYVIKQWTGSLSDNNIQVALDIDPSLQRNPMFINYINKNKGTRYRGTVYIDNQRKTIYYSMETTSSINVELLKKITKVKKKIKLSKVKGKIKNIISLYTDKYKNRYIISIKNDSFRDDYPYTNILFDLKRYKTLYECNKDSQNPVFKQMGQLYKTLMEIQ